MASYNVNDILGKLDELRAVFILGQRAVPFLEEVFSFFKEITPLLDEINASIQDSTSKVPRASSQLQSVSQATEMATSEILDVIDSLFLKLTEVKAPLLASQVHEEEIVRADANLIRLLRANLRGKDDVLLAQIETIHAQKKSLRRRVRKHVRDTVRALDVIGEKVNSIMLSLQVQDITAQQLAAVNHLIQSVGTRMNQLLERIGVPDAKGNLTPRFVQETPRPKPTSSYQEAPHPGTFDENARYDYNRSGQRQAAADSIMQGFNGGVSVGGDGHSASADVAVQPAPPSTPTSQNDIDALFGGGNGGGAASATDIDNMFGGGSSSEPASASDIDNLFCGGAPSEPASASDIDNLFGGGAPSEPASTADIDNLFGGGVSAQPSQDDIDNLFANNVPETPSQNDIDNLFSSDQPSQDDIDKLFGGG